MFKNLIIELETRKNIFIFSFLRNTTAQQ